MYSNLEFLGALTVLIRKEEWVLGKENLDVTGFEDNNIYRKQTLCSKKKCTMLTTVE